MAFQRTYIFIFLILSFFNVYATPLNYPNTISIIDQSTNSNDKAQIINCILESYKKTILFFDTNFNVKFIFVTENYTDACTNLGFEIPEISLNTNYFEKYDKSAMELVIIHELIHAYQASNTNIKLWSNSIAIYLFLEGFATYISSLIIPSYPEWKYINYYADTNNEYQIFLREKEKALKYLQTNLEISNISARNMLFTFDNQIDRYLPKRIGYFLGFRIVKNIVESSNTNILSISEAEFISKIMQYRTTP